MIRANAVLLSDKDMDLSRYGIDRISITKALSYLENFTPSVLGIHCSSGNYQQVLDLLTCQKAKNLRQCFVVFYDHLSVHQLIKINNLIQPVFSLAFEEVEDRIVDIYEKCFDHYYRIGQSEKLVELINETNEELKKLMAELEQKVIRRQTQLEKSKQKHNIAERELELLQKTLVQIYKAGSNLEIEKGITSALRNEFQIEWVKLTTLSQSNLSEEVRGLKLHKVLLRSGSRDFGHLLFFKKKNLNFLQKEKRFLNQIADAVSLSIERNYQYGRSQTLKRQWETTFDAISDPICLTDESYNILRINAGFLKKTKTNNFKKHIGQKCYQSLFGRNQICEGCRRGKIFQVRNSSNENRTTEVFDVYSSYLGHSHQPVYFQMYRDITQDLNLQRQVIESAKMAELGIISSSVAHELNNPIGGMLNFVQLMKMDMEGDEDYFEDLVNIEKGIVKCSNLVKNLLGFSRKSFNIEITDVDLNEVIEQAVKITELKTRSIGIEIRYSKPEKPVLIEGRFNLLNHAVRNILQNSQESLIEKRKKDAGFKGLIDLSLIEGQESIEIIISDNGDGFDESLREKIFEPLYTTKDRELNSGLGLTLALQIVKEHRGNIDALTGEGKNPTFKIQFFKKS